MIYILFKERIPYYIIRCNYNFKKMNKILSNI